MIRKHAMAGLAAAVSLSWLAPAATADTLVLTNGRTHEGRVIAEDGRQVEFEVHKGGVRTTLRFAKSEVAKIVRPTVPSPAPKAGKRPANTPAAKPKAGRGGAAESGKPTAQDGKAFLRLDLPYAVGRKDLLFPETVSDEGVDLKPGRGRFFLRLPIAYRLPDKVHHITRGRLKVRTGGGRLCVLKGISLDTKRVRGSSSVPWESKVGEVEGVSIRAPAAGDPLWERVTPKQRGGNVYVECANGARPKEVRGRGKTNKRRGGRSSAKRSRYDARTANGVVLFVVAVPEEAKSLVCTVKSDPPVETKLDVAMLRSLTEEGTSDPAEIRALVASIRSADGAVAQALVGKLARATPDDATADVWAQGFLSAFEHSDPDTREVAWNLVLGMDKQLPEAIYGAIAGAKKTVVYDTIVTGVTEELARAEVVDDLRLSDKRLAVVPSKLPHSTARSSALLLLNAVLGAKAAGDGAAAVDLILKHATQETVAVLADASLRVQGTTIARLKGMSDPMLLVPVVKTLLLAPDPTLVQPLLEVVRGVPIPIRDAKDPFLTAPMRVEDPVARVALLTALAQAPLAPMFESADMQKMLSTAADPKGDARSQLAVIQLIARHWRPRVPLPASGPPPRRGTSLRGAKSDVILDGLIRSPDTAVNVAAAAVGTWAAKGFAAQAATAAAGLPAERRLEIIKAVGTGAARSGPRVGAYLAAYAGSEDAPVAAAAQAAIDRLVQATPQDQRWWLASELKLHMDYNGVIRSSLEGSAESAGVALRVLATAASLDAAENAGLAATAGGDARTAYLAEIAYARAEKPAGTYRVLAYADLSAPPKAPGAAGGRNGSSLRYDVPLDLGVVRIVDTGEKAFAMVVGQERIPLKHQTSRGRRATISMRGTIEFDAKPLIGRVLARLANRPGSGSKSGGLFGKLTSLLGGGTSPAPAPVPSAVLADVNLPAAKLSYVLFGRWQGEMSLGNVRASGGAVPSWPLQRVKMILERVAGPAAK